MMILKQYLNLKIQVQCILETVLNHLLQVSRIVRDPNKDSVLWRIIMSLKMEFSDGQSAVDME